MSVGWGLAGWARGSTSQRASGASAAPEPVLRHRGLGLRSPALSPTPEFQEGRGDARISYITRFPGDTVAAAGPWEPPTEQFAGQSFLMVFCAGQSCL